MVTNHCVYPQDFEPDTFNMNTSFHDAIEMYDPFAWRYHVPLDQAVTYGLAACSVLPLPENDFSDEPDTIPNGMRFQAA